MLNILPFYPIISFLILIIFAKRLSWLVSSFISIFAIAATFITTVFLAMQLSEHNLVITSYLWTWITLGANEKVNVSFYFDGLAMVMSMVVSGVGLLIHMFAAAYMKADAHFSRFMAYMNLFIAAMLVLVLADNLVLLYLGWEGVGICSFLLIGFWYQDKSNVLAARKAFVITRIGDTALVIALLMIFNEMGQLSLPDINTNAQELLSSESAYWISLFLLGGAVGKSAQLPLQTWLPDAMAGPTPVSALIHAATMVTAGVYLIARLHNIFILSPEVMSYVAWLGALTLLLASMAALAQSDIKRVLAYSTMSQIGYMMLALGAGAFSMSIFHLMTHAFFKALLFLTAGSIIAALHHQQNIFKMGGLLKRLPFESVLFVIGLVALMALPGTSGFFSKEAIISQLWSSSTAGPLLWWSAIAGALLTSIYSCRLFFLVFLGQSRFDYSLKMSPSYLIKFSLIVLALLSVIGGLFSGFVEVSVIEVFSVNSGNQDSTNPPWLHTVALATPFVGIIFSWFYFSSYRNSRSNTLLETENSYIRFFRQGLGFDHLYSVILVKPFLFITRVNRLDIFDQLIMLNAWYVTWCHEVLILSQNGKLRWYVAALGIAVLFFLGLFTFGFTASTSGS